MLSVKSIFYIAASQADMKTLVTCSMVEVYSEKIRDLLITHTDPRHHHQQQPAAEDTSSADDLQIRMSKDGTVYLDGLRDWPVHTFAEYQSLIAAGMDAQARTSTAERTSRASIVITVKVRR